MVWFEDIEASFAQMQMSCPPTFVTSLTHDTYAPTWVGSSSNNQRDYMVLSSSNLVVMTFVTSFLLYDTYALAWKEVLEIWFDYIN